MYCTYVQSCVCKYIDYYQCYVFSYWNVYYSEIIVDPSYEELKICDSMAHIISNRYPQLDNINMEGKLESLLQCLFVK